MQLLPDASNVANLTELLKSTSVNQGSWPVIFLCACNLFVRDTYNSAKLRILIENHCICCSKLTVKRGCLGAEIEKFSIGSRRNPLIIRHLYRFSISYKEIDIYTTDAAWIYGPCRVRRVCWLSFCSSVSGLSINEGCAISSIRRSPWLCGVSVDYLPSSIVTARSRATYFSPRSQRLPLLVVAVS